MALTYLPGMGLTGTDLNGACMRTEKDHIGEMTIPADALYGIHSARAVLNFPDRTPFHEAWYRALGKVKLACYLTCREYQRNLEKKFTRAEIDGARARMIEERVLDSLIAGAGEVAEGGLRDHFIVPALCGGAGTSINMNANEIIANRALLLLGHKPGSYDIVDPVDHANIFQSTNDVIPTSLRLALMEKFDGLEKSINLLRESIEAIEKKEYDSLRIGYTQMQEAVPTSFGRLFSSYSSALSRDWWRLTRCHERIKSVNLGGSALGTGLTVPRYVIFRVTAVLREITGRPVTRAENLGDATSNLDSLVEVHAILKAHAVNLEKMAGDMRMIAADLSSIKGVAIPARQVGSSIMPGKINPVIPEYVIGLCRRVYANDSLVAGLCAQGCLELNPYIPVIGHAMLESLDFLAGCGITLTENLVRGLAIDAAAEKGRLMRSPAVATALNPVIGYDKAAGLARLMKDESLDVFEANRRLGLMEESMLAYLLEPGNMLRLGYSVSELLDMQAGSQNKKDEQDG